MKKYQNKNWLYQKYITENFSTIKIADICNVDIRTVRYWLKKVGIKIRNLSEAKRGPRHHQWGKPISNKQKKKISKSLKGRIRTENHRKNLSIALKGNKQRLGQINSKSHNRKISEAHLSRPMFQIRGEKHPNWKGGITPENHKLRTSLEFKIWRRLVFNRDNYTCQKCGIKSGDGKTVCLHVHHVLPFAKYSEKRFDLDNGLTLCKDCHLG